jgi:protein-disulfide isomerase
MGQADERSRSDEEAGVVGGAERGERKRKQQAAMAAEKTPTTAPPRSGLSRGAVAGIAVAALIAVVVGIGIWLQVTNGPERLPAAIPAAAAGAVYPVSAQGGTVVAGKPGAPVTIDVYEDFMCPACAEFEKTYGDRLEKAAASGQARVVYHPIAILDVYSEPAGYSTLAAGGAFCAAEAGIFPRYHDSLYATQPSEGGPGWSTAQIQQLGRDLGADESFAGCLTKAGPRVSAATGKASQYLSTLRPDGRIGTPTVVVNGVAADTGDENWLDQALAGARR